MTIPPTGIAGATIALVAIFLPSFLLVWGVLPFWDVLRGRSDVRRALTGVNAAVVGLLLAALITPVWTSAVSGPLDAVIAAGAALLLVGLRFPPWAVVLDHRRRDRGPHPDLQSFGSLPRCVQALNGWMDNQRVTVRIDPARAGRITVESCS